MREKSILKITHVIFDLDGLLIDTEPAYTKAHTVALEHYGKKFTLDLKPFMMGMKHEDGIKILLDKVISIISSLFIALYNFASQKFINKY